MTDRNWDKELAKIDKQLASISDEDLVAKTAVPGGPAAPKGAATLSPPAAAAPTQLGMVLRVTLAVAVAVGIHFWPYAALCGLGLAGYLAAVAVVGAAGTWASIATWRARAPKAHIVALLVIASGISLAAVEILPRVGYATDPARGAWTCK